MKSIIVGIFAVFAVFSSFTASATVNPSVGNVVLVNCSSFNTTGSTVYSVDNAIANGTGSDTIVVPSVVAPGSSCALALNSLNATTCVTSHVWTISSPVNVLVSGSKKSLQQFRFTCQ